MELYIIPLACSQAARIVAAEAGIPLVLHPVDRNTKGVDGRRASEASYLEVSALGLVPALRLDDGSLLTEVTAVVQYLADQRPESGLAPPPGTMDRYRLIEWLSFIGAEVHKRILWVLFSRDSPAEAKAHAVQVAPQVLDHLERRLTGREFLVTERFTAADAYLIWALQLAHVAGLDLRSGRPALAAYAKRLRERPSVKAIFDEERPLAMAQASATQASAASATSAAQNS